MHMDLKTKISRRAFLSILGLIVLTIFLIHTYKSVLTIALLFLSISAIPFATGFIIQIFFQKKETPKLFVYVMSTLLTFLLWIIKDFQIIHDNHNMVIEAVTLLLIAWILSGFISSGVALSQKVWKKK